MALHSIQSKIESIDRIGNRRKNLFWPLEIISILRCVCVFDFVFVEIFFLNFEHLCTFTFTCNRICRHAILKWFCFFQTFRVILCQLCLDYAGKKPLIKMYGILI